MWVFTTLCLQPSREAHTVSKKEVCTLLKSASQLHWDGVHLASDLGTAAQHTNQSVSIPASCSKCAAIMQWVACWIVFLVIYLFYKLLPLFYSIFPQLPTKFLPLPSAARQMVEVQTFILPALLKVNAATGHIESHHLRAGLIALKHIYTSMPSGKHLAHLHDRLHAFRKQQINCSVQGREIMQPIIAGCSISSSKSSALCFSLWQDSAAAA